MSKKLYAAIVPLLAVGAMAATGASSASAAEPHWFVCEKHAGTGTKFSDSECEKTSTTGEWEWVEQPLEKESKVTKIQVVTFGKLSLEVTGGPTIKCKVLDGGNIWNTVAAAAGMDEILAFTNYECTISPLTACEEGLELNASKFKWPSKLVAGTPIKDEITGITITFKCTKPATNLTFTGSLKPNFVLGHPSFFEFVAASGELEEPVAMLKAKVSGKDFIETDEGREVKAE